jgi:sugar lactone lactonase YvrE
MKNKLLPLLFSALLISATHTAHAQIITTIAGGDSTGLGDGGPATACELNNPYSTAIDAAGNLYIADAGNNRVRKVNTAGIITTIAGTGVEGYGGDDSAATTAKLAGPVGVAVDASGNLYISDDYNARIRKVNTSGIITTIAGISAYGYSGDNGPATAAKLYSPHGIAVDGSGNVYVCDALNNCIRKINTAGIITTIAGTGMPGYSGDGYAATAAKLDQPFGIALDDSGNIYFAEWGNNCVRKINTSGIINTIAGGNNTLGFSGDNGPATAADFHIPIGIAIDGNGNIYIGDSYNNRVRKINSSGIISTYAGTGIEGYSGDGGPAILAELYGPVGVTVDVSGNLYITEYANDRIRYIRNTESVNTINNIPTNINTYPNPSNGVFVISLTSNRDDIVIMTISNELGEKIKEITGHTNQLLKINIDVPQGIYFLSAATNTGTITKKILISR